MANRGVTLGRLAAILFFVFTVFFFRDFWLPQAQGAYEKYKQSVPVISSDPQEVLETPAEKFDELIVDSAPSPVAKVPFATTAATTTTTFATTTTTTHHATKPTADPLEGDEACLNLPGADRVLVMLKTGATELYQKLPTHFLTTLKCMPKYMIFSDLNQTLGGTQIHDAIGPVSDQMKQEHEDFSLYRNIHQWSQEGQDVSKLKGDSGWNLDKWKFLPMYHMAWEAAEDDIDWFVMIEADTSVSWLNLLLWLKTMDPNEPYYLGSQTYLGLTMFGHGGSGVVVSRKALEKLENTRRGTGVEIYDSAWEVETSMWCCGDAILAMAFMAVEIPLTPSWPLIQGETLSTADFNAEHWCTPAITFHHVSPIEVDSYWQFEKNWTDAHGWEEPYLYRDLFHHFIDEYIRVNHTHWNNHSNDRKLVHHSLATEDDLDFYTLSPHEQAAVNSEEACAEACAHDEECFQWMFQPGRCSLGHAIRFGMSDEREEDRWNSGWMQDRIDRFQAEQRGCTIRWEG